MLEYLDGFTEILCGVGRVGEERERERVMSKRMKDKVCIVTGSTKGIGLAIAERFLQEVSYLSLLFLRFYVLKLKFPSLSLSCMSQNMGF